MSLKDAKQFCRWLINTDLVRFLDATGKLTSPPTLAEEQEWIRAAKRSKTDAMFSVDTMEGEHIGSVGFKKIDRHNRHAEFGIMIGNPRFWGQGYGTDAAKTLLRYGFRSLRLHRIYLFVFAYNIRAQKSYYKLGFKKEGVLREHLFQRGSFHNDIVMGILRKEFLSKKK